MDAGEELLEVRLDDERVLGLAEDLEQVVVADEVEAREALPLVLEEVGEGLARVRVRVRVRARVRVRKSARAFWQRSSWSSIEESCSSSCGTLASEKTRGSSPMPSMIARKSSSTRRKRACSCGMAPRPKMGSR